jgi:hypothetical protein
MLVKAGFVVALVLVNVSGFRPVLARGWHGRAVTARVRARGTRRLNSLPLTRRLRVSAWCLRSDSAVEGRAFADHLHAVLLAEKKGTVPFTTGIRHVVRSSPLSVPRWTVVHDVEHKVHGEAQQQDHGIDLYPPWESRLRGICLPHTGKDNAGDHAESHPQV